LGWTMRPDPSAFLRRLAGVLDPRSGLAVVQTGSLRSRRAAAAWLTSPWLVGRAPFPRRRLPDQCPGGARPTGRTRPVGHAHVGRGGRAEHSPGPGPAGAPPAARARRRPASRPADRAGDPPMGDVGWIDDQGRLF